MQSGVPHRTSQAVVLLVGLCSAIAFSDEPEWVAKRPVLPEFYVGIGMARKDRPAAEYTEGARNIALNDIASQITVSISSDVLRTVLEKNEHLEEEFESRIRASTPADLEGVQLVDTYETDEGYWVYYRLSRADYAARRAGTLTAAAAQSLDLYSRGRKDERAGRIGQALGLYAQAFGPIEKYLAEPLVVQDSGQPVYLVNEIYDALRTLLSRIDLRTTDEKHEGKIGRPLRKPLETRVVLRGSVSSSAANIPIRFRFTRGSGDCVDLVRTDSGGIARCDVRTITSPENIQTVEAGVDLLALAGGEQTSAVVQTVLGSLSPPEIQFILEISGVDVVVDSRESMFGQPLHEKRIEPVVKSELGSRHFSFVDDRSKASLAISIRADARKGAESFGLAFAFASATVSVLDLETGREIYTGSIIDVKEGSDSFEKAAYRGLDVLARRIAAEVVPRLVEETRK